jgi:glycosyltransferase involved in cell wall biosynthesis
MTRFRPNPAEELTLVIPAFNESSRLGATLAAVEKRLNRSAIDYRVLVVDDGSADDTAEQTDRFGRRFSTLRLPENRGKGAAVRAGMLQARGAVVAFTDADLPFELSSLIEGCSWIRRGESDAVFGARNISGSSEATARRFSRRMSSAAFRQIVSLMISREITDTQCGLKLFSREAALEIFSRMTIDGFAFDVEVVYLARRMGFSLRRIPVQLINERTSSLSLMRHTLPMLADVVRVRLRRYPELAGVAERLRAVEQPLPQRKAA